MSPGSKAVHPLVVFVLIIGTIGLAIWLRPATARFDTAASFETGGFAFDYPADWTVHDQMPMTTGPGNLIAVLGTLPWGPCGPSDINCHFEQRLGPGQIEVQVGRRYLFGEDGICGFARDRPDLAGRGSSDPQVVETHYFRIDGRPAIYTGSAVGGSDYYLSDEWRDWLIAPWDTTFDVFSIDAKFRGPGDEEFRATLDQLIGSIHLESRLGPGYPAATTCSDPFPPM